MQKEQKTILGLGLVALLIIVGGVMAWQTKVLEPTPVKSSNAVLSVSPEKFDFGEVSMARGNVSTKFELKNDSDEPLNISEIKTSCMCTTAEVDGQAFGMHGNNATNIVLPAKSSKEMTVTFDPNAHGPDAVGPITRVISIRTNSSINPPKEIHVIGNVVK